MQNESTYGEAEKSAAYLAGLIDGEAYIAIIRGCPKLSLAMSEKAKPVLDWASDRWGGRVTLKRAATSRWAASYGWNITGPRLRGLVYDVRPFVRLKHSQIEGIAAFYVSRGKRWQRARSSQTRAAMKALSDAITVSNARGPQAVLSSYVPHIGMAGHSDAYLAGLIDGEGYLGLSTDFRPILDIAWASKAANVLRSLQSEWGGSLTTVRRTQDGWSDVRRWKVKGQQLRSLLIAVRPHLKLKASQADILLARYDAIGIEPKHRLVAYCGDLRAALLVANKRGPDGVSSVPLPVRPPGRVPRVVAVPAVPRPNPFGFISLGGDR